MSEALIKQVEVKMIECWLCNL